MEEILVEEPKVGIFWYTNDYKIIVSDVHDSNHEFVGHFTVWYRLMNAGLLKEEYSDAEWDTYKRGRVENSFAGYFTVYSGEFCYSGECKNKKFVDMVVSEFKLKSNTTWVYSAHYDREMDMTKYQIGGEEVEE